MASDRCMMGGTRAQWVSVWRKNLLEMELSEPNVPVRTAFEGLLFCNMPKVLKAVFDSQQNFPGRWQLCAVSLSRRRRQMYFNVTFVNYVVTSSHKENCDGNSSLRNRKISVLKLFAQEARYCDVSSGCPTVKLKYYRNILHIFYLQFFIGSRYVNGAVCLF